MNSQFLRFVCVGVAGFAVDAGTVFALSKMDVPPIVSRIPALVAAILTTWILNRRITFGLRESAEVTEVARYFSVAITSAILNFIIYSALVVVGTTPILAVAIATLVLMFFSFFGYRSFAFKIRK